MSSEVNDHSEIDQNHPGELPPAVPNGEVAAPQLEPLRSVHTVSFPQILQGRGISVLVTTYQAGRLVVLHRRWRTEHALPRLFQADGVGRSRQSLGDRAGDGNLRVP